MLILHTSDLLAEAYAARLLASLAGVALEIRHLDIHPGRDHETDAFRVLSPLGRLPVLEGAGAPLADWQAVLCAIATRGDTPARADAPGWWRGADPAFIGWLGMARDLAASAGVARLHEGLGVPADGAALRAAAHALLREVERHLWFAERAGQRWLLAGEGPCAADIACYVHIALCEEGGIARMDYPAIRRWVDRIRHLPGYIVTSGTFAPPAPAPVRQPVRA